MMPNFKFYYYSIIDSTNSKAKRLTKKGLFDIVLIAREQTRGKGRFKRKWFSDVGGLYMTIVLKIKDLDKAKFLTFAAALSVIRTIRKLTKLNALVKWPNDVLINGKKICGILTETTAGKDNYSFVGIGLNVNQKKFSRQVSGKAKTKPTIPLINITKVIV